MIHGTFAFPNGIIVALNPKNEISIKFDDETLLSLGSQDIKEKRIFNNGLGEHIIELSGLSSKDARFR